MVVKKVSLLSIITLAMGLATVLVGLSSHPAHALEGNFRWTAPDTIMADGYSQSGAITFKGTPPTLRSTETVTQRSANPNTVKGCTFNATITVDMGNTANAQVAAEDVNNSFLDACDKDALSGDITLGDVNKGPQAANTINYATVNCADNAKNGGDQAKCNAVKACIGTAKSQADCLSAYNTCISNHTQDGNIADADRTACIDNVTKGDLAAANTPAADTKDKSTCAIDGIGWLICPVVNFLAKIVDAAYGFVASLLAVQPLLTTGQTQGIYEAWSMMRNFANVAFVIAFLIIIFSQLTSVGITNYGIKKMLPRLVVAAILVNVSYWVCAIAVDLSNISGSSLVDLFKSLNAALATPNAGALGAQGQGWTGIAEGILSATIVTGAVLFIGLSALLPMLVIALMAIFTVFLVLTLRQALIILLIVVAPLAFVAYLLPNTESLFKKWRELFQTLLLMYPIIALIFGASALASTIVMGTASGPYKIAIQIMGAGIGIIPLAITPLVMRTAGGILNRFGGWFNNPNKGPFDRMKKGAEGYRKNRQQLRDARALGGGVAGFQLGRGSFVRSRAKRQAVLAQRERNYNTAKTGYIANAALSKDVSKFQRALGAATSGEFGGKTKGEQLLNKMANGGDEAAKTAALAQALTMQQNLDVEEVKAANAVIQNANLTSDQQQLLAKGGAVAGLDGKNTALRIAAIQNQMKTAPLSKAEDLVMSSGGIDTGNARDDTRLRQAIADGVNAGGHNAKADYLGGDMHDRITKGEIKDQADLDAAAARRIENGKLSADKLTGQDADALARFADVAARAKGSPGKAAEQFNLAGVGQTNITNVTQTNINALSDQAHLARTDDDLKTKITKQQAPSVDALGNLYPHP